MFASVSVSLSLPLLCTSDAVDFLSLCEDPSVEVSELASRQVCPIPKGRQRITSNVTTDELRTYLYVANSRYCLDGNVSVDMQGF